jgi:hypothetical protein
MSNNLNGTYKGRVYDSGESNAATLTITSSDPETGNIAAANMSYYGYDFVVDGVFAYQYLTDQSPVSLNLRAEVKSGENILLNITLTSPDRSYTTLNGNVYVSRGGPNVGKTYDITFNRA